MTVLTFTFLLLIVGYASGLLGALTGLGGGVIIVPILVLAFQVDIHYAMGASLICVIATSSGTSIAYLKEFANLRIGMFLESAAVIGALIGAWLVFYVPTGWIALIFGLMLILSAFLTMLRNEENEVVVTPSHPWAEKLQLEGQYLSHHGYEHYRVHHVPLAWMLMVGAGILSGLLGIGSGALKVLSMDQAMRLPYKVATTTSNFMIGMTAAASAGVFFTKGYIDPLLTFPLLLGIVAGAHNGSIFLIKLHSKTLRAIFSVMILLLAVQMIFKGLTGKI